MFALLRQGGGLSMKDFDLAFHGPGRELVLPWRVPSRLQSPGKSPDLEETSYKRGSGSELALEVEYKYGTISWNLIPSTTVLPSRGLPFQDGVTPLAFLLWLNSIATALLAPSVHVGWGERIIMGSSKFSVIGLFSVTWIVLYRWTNQHPSWILRLF